MYGGWESGGGTWIGFIGFDGIRENAMVYYEMGLYGWRLVGIE